MTSIIKVFRKGFIHPLNVNEQFQFYGGDNNVLPSNGWFLKGAHELNNFGNIVRRFSVQEILNGEVPWHWKNGKQRSHIICFDHGSVSRWSGEHSIWLSNKGYQK